MSYFIENTQLEKSIWGVPDGVSMLALSGWLGSGARLVYVARDDARMMAMREGLSRLAPQVETHLFPAWDCLPFDRLSPQGALVGQRVETLARLAEGGAGSGAGAVLLTTVNAVLQRVPPQSYFSERSLVLAAGDSTGPARLCDFLVGQGYLRTDTVRETGEFALRGGILDIYPPGRGAPVRLDFFGDELETIRDFDAATQRSGGPQDRLVLRPVAEFQLDEASIERFRTGYRAAFGAMASRDALYDSVTAGRMHPGMEHWLPLFHEELALLTDYCADWQLVLDHEADAAIAARFAQIQDFHGARQEPGDDDPDMAYRPLATDRLYPAEAEAEALLANAVRMMPFAAPPGDEGRDAAGAAGASGGAGGTKRDGTARHEEALVCVVAKGAAGARREVPCDSRTLQNEPKCTSEDVMS